MNKILKAADEVRKLHRMFSALGEVVDVLERVGSLEQAENEARARIDRLNAEAESLKDAVDAARARVEDIKAAGVKLEAEAAQRVEILKAAAIEEAQAIVADAKREANRLIEAARVQVEQAENKAQAYAIDVEIKAKELAEIEKKIEQARARISKLLGV